MKPQSKIFLVINKNDNGDGRGQSSWFSNGLWTKGNYQSNKLLIFRSNKLMKYPSRISNKDSRNA